MKPLNRAILSIALPSIVANITTPLLGLMDVAFTGHMGSATYLAAIAVGGTIFNMIYWIFGFLRMGTSGMTAQAFGRAGDDGDEASAILMRGMTTSLTAGILILLLRIPIGRLSLAVMDVDTATADAAMKYFTILSAGAPAVLSTYVITGWLLGMQNAKAAMWISLVINAMNLVASCALVIGLDMKIEGVATGTLIAQWSGFILGLVIIARRYKVHFIPLKQLLDFEEIKRYFSINSDIFLRTLCLVAVTVWFTKAGALQGTLVLAANTLLMQFFMFFTYFVDGFAYAGEALTGRYIGSRDRTNLRLTISTLLKWGLWIGLIFTVIYFVAGQWIVSMLTSEESVVEASREYIGWVVLVPLAGFSSFTLDGIYIGATMTRRMLISMGVGMIVFFSIYFLTYKAIGNHGVWLAFIIYLATRGVILFSSRHKIIEQL
ncbi:MAG: MATE family efflux transporter [Lachnoclostridium sp.]|nr:MATE family efflux transporter [Lachnoclostridium sp.]